MRFTTIDRGDPHTHQIVDTLLSRCQDLGWILDHEHPQVVLSVGGDGTLLRGIHKYIDQLDQVSFVGIHTGTLGFYTDYTWDEIDTFLEDIQKDQVVYEEMPLLEMYFSNGDKQYALNEVRIESISRTLSLDIWIDDEFFERTTGSGICISTQAGSTAINRALKGAIIDNGLHVLQLCEIMPISHKNHHSLQNPYIMREDRIVKVKGDGLSLAKAAFDHLEQNLSGIEWINIQTSLKKARFARFRKYSYLKRLKNLY